MVRGSAPRSRWPSTRSASVVWAAGSPRSAREAKPAQPERGQVAREIMEGLRFVLAHSALRAIAVTASLSSCSAL